MQQCGDDEGVTESLHSVYPNSIIRSLMETKPELIECLEWTASGVAETRSPGIMNRAIELPFVGENQETQKMM
jgi:hypothetical protein